MMTLKTPILSILIGEGGSGGALALAVADEVWMLKNATYSVIAPESCANILWRNPDKAPEAAESLKLTAKDVYALGVVERIITERGGIWTCCTRLWHPTSKAGTRRCGR
jgi:acetyl-CoA carboxylase carboxyl transferase subunit alpha